MSSGPLAVEALAPGSDQPAASGTLVFVDNAVDPSTGTIKLRAQFRNNENALWPGQFVNVRIKLYDQKDALVVPSRSVQTGPAGQYVFVVKPDMTTEVRKVTVQRTEGDRAIIATGLEKGERVVTQGQLRLGAGAKVVVKS
jgi:multidrug efflux system membrane fusion protein